MPQFTKVFATILLAVVVAILTGNAFADGGEVTTGQFLVAVAKAHNFNVSDPANAADSLRAAGYAMPKVAFDKPLTEGVVVSIAAALQLNVTTQEPEAAFSETQVDVFLQSFGQELATRGDQDTRSDSASPEPPIQIRKRTKTKSCSDPL